MYERARMQRVLDAVAGVGLAVAGIPITLAIAVASGLPVQAAFASAAAAGLVFHALGGRRIAVVGPNLVFVPLTIGVLTHHGPSGLLVACALAGLIQVLLGVFRVGRAFAAAPNPVVRGLYVAAAGSVLAGMGSLGSTGVEWPIRPVGLFAGDVLALLPFAGAIALASSLVSLGPLDSGEVRSAANCDNDLVALGLANTASALVAGIPVALAPSRTMLSRSTGVQTRASGVAHALVAALFVVAWHVQPPRAVLLGLVVVAALHALDLPRALRARPSRVAMLSLVVIVVAAAAFDFSRAVLLATAIALTGFARARGRLRVTVSEGAVVVAKLEGELFFASRPDLARLHELEPPTAMVLDVSRVSLIDASGVHALAQLVDSLRARGCRVDLVADEPLRRLLAVR